MIDLQINGYWGIDFNNPQMTLEQFQLACERLREDGVTGFLPTIITGALSDMEQCLRQLAVYRQHNALMRQMVRGFHIEGPFLNASPGYIGAHPPEHACQASVSTMQRLLDAAQGHVRIVTLAPEQDPQAHVTQFLSDQGVTVAAGHTDASLDQLRRSIDAGLSMMTHLGNGCPLLMHRHDNIIQRVLSLSDQLWVSLIADGAHVPWFAFGNYVSRIGIDRVVVVSDAISAAGLGPGEFTLAGQTVRVGPDLVPRAPDNSHFVGAAVPLHQAAKNLRQLGYSDDAVHRMCVVNAERLLQGAAPSLGR